VRPVLHGDGKRKKGGQRKGYGDTLGASLKSCDIGVNNWESMAHDLEASGDLSLEGSASFAYPRAAGSSLGIGLSSSITRESLDDENKYA